MNYPWRVVVVAAEHSNENVLCVIYIAAESNNTCILVERKQGESTMYTST